MQQNLGNLSDENKILSDKLKKLYSITKEHYEHSSWLSWITKCW
jgi:hypothetical protein